MRSDSQRGDRTFAIEFGVTGVKKFYRNAFHIGLLMSGLPLILINWPIGLAFVAAGLVTGRFVGSQISLLTGDAGEYASVMKVKYLTSLSFVGFILAAMVVVHVLMD
jgi:hypothetical protein